MTKDRFENLDYHVSDGVVSLVLNRPPANVMNIAMLSEMQTALKVATNESDLKVLLLRAEGKLFSGGVDIADHTPERVGEMIPLFNQVCAWLYAFPAPTIAVVQGHALGGGCELVICCDFAYMKQGARIGQPEIQLAAMAPIAALRLPSLVGDRWAARLLFMGEQIDAAKAAEIELINQAYPEDELESAVEALVSQLTALSAPVLRINKRGLLLGMRGGLSELQTMEKLYLDELMALDDAEEGLKAFLEKRKPEWKDR